MVLHWILSDSKSLQVSKTLFSILTDLNNAVIEIVSIIRLLISNSSGSFEVFENRASATIGITVTLMFHSFFRSLARSK